MSIVTELKRRNVFRVGIAYVLLGWVVMQAADFALDLVDAPNWIIQVFFIAGLAGLPIALFFAWAFEMTPEGIKREQDVDRSSSLTPQTGRKLDRAIIFFLAVSVGFLLVQNYWPRETLPTAAGPKSGGPEAILPSPGLPSIAVLPFADMSPEGDQAYFADGISEEILNVLVKTDGIKVTGRTSSFQFRGRNEDLTVIGEKLGVEHILEGSLRKANNRIRITAQLVKADDGFHLWSETYDRELNDIFAVQDEIARAITDALAVELELGTEQLVQASTGNMQAYDKFLTARSLLAVRTDFDRIRSLLDEATTLDPDFAPAWAAFAQAHALSWYYETVNSQFVLSQAEVMARRAMMLNPGLSQAYSVLGDVNRDRNQYTQARPHYEKAIELNPSDIEANQQYAQLLLRTRSFALALKHSNKSVELDPLSWINLATHSMLMYMVGQRDAGQDFLERSFEASGTPRDFQVRNALYFALSDGDFERARKMTTMLPQARRQEIKSVFFQEHLQSLINLLDDPEAALEFLRADSPARFDMGSYSLWLVDAAWAAWFGDLELAANMIERGIDNINNIDGSWLYLPMVAQVMKHRPDLFRRIITDNNIDDYWQAYGYPEGCRAVNEDEFECEL